MAEPLSLDSATMGIPKIAAVVAAVTVVDAACFFIVFFAVTENDLLFQNQNPLIRSQIQWHSYRRAPEFTKVLEKHHNFLAKLVLTPNKYLHRPSPEAGRLMLQDGVGPSP